MQRRCLIGTDYVTSFAEPEGALHEVDVDSYLL
jgi:hypothetical protein